MKYKIISAVLLIVGIIVIVVGFGSLMTSSIEREAYLYDSQTGSGYNIYYTDNVEGEHNYSIIVSVTQVMYDVDSRVDANVIIYIDGTEVVNTQLYDFDYLETDDHSSRAYDYTEYDFTTQHDVNITIVGSLVQGDSWEIVIYQDLPTSIDTETILSMIILLVGFVCVLVGFGILARERSR